MLTTTPTNVKRPYALPIKAGTRMGWLWLKRVEELGVPLFHDDNNSAIVPVRFSTGKYDFLSCEGKRVTHFDTQSEEAERLIAQSSKMPFIRRGIGSDVWHIIVGKDENDVLIKVYYNYKADRGVEIYAN